VKNTYFYQSLSVKENYRTTFFYLNINQLDAHLIILAWNRFVWFLLVESKIKII